MISVRHLRHMRAIIEHRSIMGAAEAVYITQSALTRSLTTLENTLGVKLFERSKSGMTPTPFCENIEALCQQALVTIDEIKREADIYRNIEGGELHIAVGGAIMQQLLHKTLPEFAARHPAVSVIISTGAPEQIVHSLTNRAIDLIIAGVASYRDFIGIQHEKISNIPLAIFVRPNHPLTNDKKFTTKDLTHFPIIAAQALSETSTSHPVRKTLPDFSGTPNIVCRDYLVLKNILLATDSCLVAPSIQYAEDCAKGEICMLDMGAPSFAIELAIIEAVGRSRSPAANEFLQICKEHLGAADAE